MNSVPYRKFAQVLKKNDFRPVRHPGGHEVWERTQTLSIPAHGEINGALVHGLSKQFKLGL